MSGSPFQVTLPMRTTGCGTEATVSIHEGAPATVRGFHERKMTCRCAMASWALDNVSSSNDTMPLWNVANPRL